MFWETVGALYRLENDTDSTPAETVLGSWLEETERTELTYSAILQALTPGQEVAYREGYPTLVERMELARTAGENTAVRLLYGQPHDFLSVEGYVGWRVGGSLVVFAALWGLLGAVRAMRARGAVGRR